MTLATLRVYIWKASGDLLLYYKSNGRKPELEQRWAEQKAKAAAGKQGEAETSAPASTENGSTPTTRE
jgi:hypothetical protein